jgi:xanthine phosphoribosyltransferase
LGGNTVKYFYSIFTVCLHSDNRTNKRYARIPLVSVEWQNTKEAENFMQLLEERIRRDGKVRAGNVLKVDSFLNHQMDIELFNEIGREFYRLFGDSGVTKILTIEASGIGIACVTAQYFHVPVVFAKKNQTKNIDGGVYTTQVESFTHGRVYDIRVAKEFLRPGDRVLLIDDFLANGKALMGLSQLVKDAGAALVGAGVVIEKGFQKGGDRLREQGIRVESLAIVDAMDEEGTITFR